jgi:hypothetical protein
MMHIAMIVLLHVILMLVSIFVECIILKLDELTHHAIIFAVVSSAVVAASTWTISSIPFLLESSAIMPLLCTAAWTDAREELILTVNKILLWVIIVVSVLMNLLVFGQHYAMNALAVLVATIACMLMRAVGGISAADIPLVVSLVLLWPDRVLYVVGLLMIFVALLGIPVTIWKRANGKKHAAYVAGAPLVLATAVSFAAFGDQMIHAVNNLILHL